MADLAKIEALTTELVASSNRFLDGIRRLNFGMVEDEPLTTTQKTNIKNRAKAALTGIEAAVAAIRAEIGA